MEFPQESPPHCTTKYIAWTGCLLARDNIRCIISANCFCSLLIIGHNFSMFFYQYWLRTNNFSYRFKAEQLFIILAIKNKIHQKIDCWPYSDIYGDVSLCYSCANHAQTVIGCFYKRIYCRLWHICL